MKMQASPLRLVYSALRVIPRRQSTAQTSRFVMALTTDQQKLRRSLRESADLKKPSFVQDASPKSIIVNQLRSEEVESKSEHEFRFGPELHQLAEDLEEIEEDRAREELSQLSPDALKCGGCGVQLQTRREDDLGYVDPTLLADAVASAGPRANASFRLEGIVCRRCNLLAQTRVVPGKRSLLEDEFDKVFSTIRDLPAATIVLVVDIADLEASILPDLFDRLGEKDYVVVGNKVDQLVPDRKAFQERWRQLLRRRVMRATGIPRSRLRGLELVSARSGFGIERLITVLTNSDLVKQPTFLVGCTNVGKSSLFNRLLWSDFCKAVARDHVPKATVSLWPGTTVSTLKFPTVNFTANQKVQRMERLRQAWRSEEKKMRQRFSNFYDPLGEDVELTFESGPVEIVDQHQGLTRLPTYSLEKDTQDLLSSDYTDSVLEDRFLRRTVYDERLCSPRRWCYDTPGFVLHTQLTNFLSIEEISQLRGSESRLRFLPRTFVLRPGRSLLLGGIGRIDVVEGPRSLLLTTFCNLPHHIAPAEQAEEYIRHFGDHLRLPQSQAVRPRPLPPTVPHDFNLDLPIAVANSNQQSSVDVVFGGVGWVSVTVPPHVRQQRAEDGEEEPTPLWRHREEKLKVHLRAYFPEGLFCSIRNPSMLPFCVQQRGSRVGSTCEYKTPPDIMERKFVDSKRRLRRTLRWKRK